jgi:hypothetical protein
MGLMARIIAVPIMPGPLPTTATAICKKRSEQNQATRSIKYLK